VRDIEVDIKAAHEALPFREVRRKLEAAGFVEVGQTGSHIKFADYVGRNSRGDRSEAP